VRVYQGERKIATQNHMLGSFRLVGIMSAPRNIPQIEVSFDIDTDGIVNVNAKDLGTGKEQGMVVTGRNKLDPTEINKMVEDAKRNEEEDNRRKQEIEMKNQADNLVYSIEKILKESGDKIPGDLRSKVESLKNDLRDAVNKENMQRIKVLMDALNVESMKMGAFLYKQPNAGPDPNDVQTRGQSGPNPATSPLTRTICRSSSSAWPPRCCSCTRRRSDSTRNGVMSPLFGWETFASIQKEISIRSIESKNSPMKVYRPMA